MKVFKKFSLLLLIVVLVMLLLIPIQAEAAIKISKAKATMEVDSTLKLKVSGTSGTVKWSTSNSKIVTVKSGLITAKKEGNATVTAAVSNKKYTCTVTVVDSNKVTTAGTIKNPFVLKNGVKLDVYDYKNIKTVSIKLTEVIDGENANSLVASENMFNEVPSDSNRWVLYHFSIDYLSGSDELYVSDVISSYEMYNEKSNTSLKEVAKATLDETLKSARSLSLYEDGSGDFWIGLLLDNDIDYVTLILEGYDNSFTKHTSWMTTK